MGVSSTTCAKGYAMQLIRETRENVLIRLQDCDFVEKYGVDSALWLAAKGEAKRTMQKYGKSCNRLQWRPIADVVQNQLIAIFWPWITYLDYKMIAQKFEDWQKSENGHDYKDVVNRPSDTFLELIVEFGCEESLQCIEDYPHDEHIGLESPINYSEGD